jgi:hypothetical protein
VEGPSDQHYLTAIKIRLIKAGKLRPSRDLVFPPAGGVKGVKAVASMIVGRDEALPYALFDSDAPGRQTIQHLRDSLYAANPDRLLSVSQYVSLPDAEVEDLFPTDLVAKAVDNIFRSADMAFSDGAKTGEAIVGQIERWARHKQYKTSTRMESRSCETS